MGSAENEPKLRLMVLGEGGREHALAQKLSKSPKVETVVVRIFSTSTFFDWMFHNIMHMHSSPQLNVS
jgi:phosphoribosylamine-glycine ligase